MILTTNYLLSLFLIVLIFKLIIFENCVLETKFKNNIKIFYFLSFLIILYLKYLVFSLRFISIYILININTICTEKINYLIILNLIELKMRY